MGGQDVFLKLLLDMDKAGQMTATQPAAETRRREHAGQRQLEVQRQSSILVLRFVVEGLVSCTLHADVSVRVGDIESRQFGSAVLSGIMGVFHV